MRGLAVVSMCSLAARERAAFVKADHMPPLPLELMVMLE